MLKTTFPHLGNFHIPCKALLHELDLEPVVPPPTSGRTIALGTQIAPEFACFPLKVNLGNYIEAIEAGAECVFMAGGVGPCRFGYYGEVQREILKDAGYPVDFFVFEAPQTQPWKLWSHVKRFVPRRTVSHLRNALYIFWLKARAIDEFDRLANKIRPVEQSRGITSRIQNDFYHQIDNAATAREVKTILANFSAQLKTVAATSAPEALRIVLVGEIYMVLEFRVNFQIEKTLGEMGVEVKRTIYLSDWILEHLCSNLEKADWFKRLQFLAKPYLENAVGGHGLETIAHTVAGGVNRFQGAIELAPFTCMPEIVAMQALPAVSRDYSLPILTLILDEHSAAAGIETRLEAFIDLLRYKNMRSPERTISNAKNSPKVKSVN